MQLIDILTAPWAITPVKLLEIQAIYATHLRGDKIDVDAIEARLQRPLASEQQEYSIREGGVAVLSIEGVIAPKANMFTRISGGVSAQMALRQAESAIADARVKSLVLAIDSPGGSTLGSPELGAGLRELAAIKPIVTVSDGVMCSAAYWVGSAANAVFISGPTVQVGSIGVVATHSFDPRNAAQVTEITAGRYKRMASTDKPLTEEGRAYMQAMVDHLYSVFVNAVADNRGTSADAVLEHMADGRVFIGQQAIDAGLVDGVATVDAIVDQLAANPAALTARRRAQVGASGTPKPSGAGVAQQADATPPPVSRGTTMPFTREQLQAEAPELLQSILAEGHTAGATAERARIQGIEAQAMPGHQALIDALKFDGKSTGADAAMAIVAAEKAQRGAQAAAMAADAPAPLAQIPAPAVQTTAAARDAATEGLPVEDRCKAKYDASADLRKEFGSLAAFTAFTRAEEAGNARILNKKA